MNRQRRDAAERLASILARENECLEVLDYHGVGACLHEKRTALANFETSASQPDEPTTAADQALAVKLNGLAGRNRTLLERRLRTQNQIMEIVAGAARRTGQSSLYAACGQRARPASNQAVALITRA